MPRIIHFEINADEPEKIIEFYKNTFGWTIQNWEGPTDYWLVMTGEGEGIDGGIAKAEGEERIINTIGVDDLDAYMKKVEENGGTIVRQKSAIPGIGWLAYFIDPEDNLHGMMQSDPKAK
jgi:hypothetical protein